MGAARLLGRLLCSEESCYDIRLGGAPHVSKYLANVDAFAMSEGLDFGYMPSGDYAPMEGSWVLAGELVDEADVRALTECYWTTNCWADGNFDGFVDARDAAILAAHMGMVGPIPAPQAGIVPLVDKGLKREAPLKPFS